MRNGNCKIKNINPPLSPLTNPPTPPLLKGGRGGIIRWIGFAAIIFSIAVHADCLAGDTSFATPFSISHPDKKVSAPAIAVHEDKVYISYIREEGDVYVTALSTDGKSILPSVKVNDKSVPANGIHQSPGLALGAKGEIYIIWVSPREEGEFAADIRFTRSMDGGRTFLPSIVINDNQTMSSRGFESIAVGKDGVIFISWLDGREKLVPGIEYGAGSAGIKQGRQGLSSAYFARSSDGGKVFEKNIKLEDNACPCCRTALAVGQDGAVYVSWRKVFEGDIRDMVVASSSDYGRTFNQPVVVSEDKWAIQGCPHRGPSMAVDDKGLLYYTWYTEGSNGLPAIYLSMSTDRGKTFTAKQMLPSGDRVFPDHPRLAVNKDGIVYLVWEEKTPVLSKIMFATYKRDKGFSKPEQLSHGVRRSYDPVVVVGMERADHVGVNDGNTVALVQKVYVIWGHDEIRFTRTVLKIGKEQGAESKE